ncbi:hypothetical protein ABPG77_008878 [Micractinium sp. CCAP 211/92]
MTSALADLKAQLRRLEAQRGAIEAEIAQRSARLEAAGVGMQARLVDEEGFPRADVDVAAIRADRHAIIIIDELAEGSPAAAAGLQLYDQLCSFGGVTRQTPDTLQAVAALLREGQAMEAVVLRHGAPLVLSLTPRTWAGRGLLGCHLRPW